MSINVTCKYNCYQICYISPLSNKYLQFKLTFIDICANQSNCFLNMFFKTYIRIIKAVSKNTMYPPPPPEKAMFLKILWLVLFEIPKCNESVVLKKNIPMGGGVKKKSHPWGGHSIFSGTSLSSFTYHINDLLSSHLIDSAPPLSICTSQSLTNIIIPPK